MYNENVMNISANISIYQKVKVEVTQSCLTLYNPRDYAVHGILQTGILQWVAFPFSRGSSQPGDLPNPGIEPRSPTLQEDSLPAEPQGKPPCNRGKSLNPKGRSEYFLSSIKYAVKLVPESKYSEFQTSNLFGFLIKK